MKRFTIVLIALAIAAVLAGCEAEDAGTARANSAAMQKQMSEMAGLVSTLIEQNEQLQSETVAASSGRNVAAWVLGTVLAVLAIVGGGIFAVWYVRYTHPHPAQPGGVYQAHVLPPPQQAAGMLPEPSGWQLVQRGDREFMIDFETGQAREVVPVALLEDGE